MLTVASPGAPEAAPALLTRRHADRVERPVSARLQAAHRRVRRAVVRRILEVVCAVALLMAGARVARADEGLRDPLARELKVAGDAAMQSLRYEEALAAYERATEIEPSPILLFNRGRALQALHRYPEALEHFEAFVKQATPELRAQAGELDELIARLQSQVSTLELTCNVKGATVLVRGTKIGVTPLEAPARLNAGVAALTVTANGYAPYERQIELPGAGELRLELRLKPLKTRGRVTISSPVAGAMVFVDGERLGTVPAEAALPSGRHRVRLERPGYEAAETTVEIADGESRTVSLALEQEPGLLGKWWFWTTAGVVVAGGVGLTVALMTERKPDRGDIAPGVISAPLLRF